MRVARAGGPAAAAPVAAGPTTIKDPEGIRLVAQCLAGDAAARQRFQQQFGPLIYRFADHAGDGATESGDFYVYLFDDDRLYRRLRSFEGRASLGPFLRGYVLPDFFRQFTMITKRHALETVSLDSDCARDARAVSAAVQPLEARGEHDARVSGSAGLIAQLSPDRRLLVKLLYIEDFELAPEDVQLLVESSGRTMREAVELVEQARRSVREREAKRQGKLGEAESAAQWILQYERRLARLAEDLGNVPPQSARAEGLRTRQAEITRKRAWRQQQRERALAEGQRATVTLRYREIAAILNQPVGTVSAQITRLRQELLQLAAQQAGARSASPSLSGSGQQ